MVSADAASKTVNAEGATTGRAFGVLRSRRLAWLLALMFGAMVLVHAVVFETFTVPSASMQPTFRPGDRIVVNKLATVPRRGQVVVFSGEGSLVAESDVGGFRGAVEAGARWFGFHPDETDFLKRIIAVGGDRVRVGTGGVLWINGKRVREPYLPPGMTASQEPFAVTVPRGEVFVMGDNRNHSNDSRNHLGDPGGGFVPVEKIIGTVSWRYWSG